MVLGPVPAHSPSHVGQGVSGDADDIVTVASAAGRQKVDLRPLAPPWLALLLTRVAERSVGQSRRHIRRETTRLKQVTLAGEAGTITQTTPLRPGHKAIYQVLSITPPPRVTAFDPA